MAERWPRGGREMAERWPRDGREMAERWPRGGREVAERWPGGGREVAERWPKPRALRVVLLDELKRGVRLGMGGLTHSSLKELAA